MKKINLLKINWMYFFVLLTIIYLPFLVLVKLHFENTVDLELKKDTLFYYQGFEKTYDHINARMTQTLENVNLLTTQAGVMRGLEIFSTLDPVREQKLAEFFSEQVANLRSREIMVSDVVLLAHTGEVFGPNISGLNISGDILLREIQSKDYNFESPLTLISTELIAVSLKIPMGIIVPIYGVADANIASYAIIGIDLEPLNLSVDFPDGVTKALVTQNSLLWGANEDYTSSEEEMQLLSTDLVQIPWTYIERLDLEHLAEDIRAKVNRSFTYYVAISLISILILALVFYLLLENKKQDQINRVKLQLIEENHRKLLVYKHDIMNHLQVITGLLEIETPDKALNYIQQLSKESNYAMKQYDLGIPEIEVLIFSYVKQAKALNIPFEVTLSPIENFTLDVYKVNTILTNLLKNAFEATAKADGDHKRIHLSITEFDEAYNFTVNNTVPIIPENMRDKIFERSVSTNGENRGLGLHIATTTVQELQGQIKLYVTKAGNSFSVTLPK